MAAWAFFLLYRQGLAASLTPILASMVLLLAAFGIRLWFLDTTTLDYEWFLSPWVEHFRYHGGFTGLGIPVGNYNVPYLYFLAGFSYIPIPDLHLIKLLSFFFDVLLAYYVMKTVSIYTENKNRQRIAFFAVLFLPTVFLNSAYWGQCESIYAAFAVMSFYCAMKDKPILSMAALALALTFKLQVVFLFPLFLVFLFTKKIRLRHLPVFPAVYILSILPAVIAGQPFWDTLLFYIGRGGNPGLNYNSPSVFAFNRGPNYNDTLAMIGIIAAFALVVLVYLSVFLRHKRRAISNEDYLVLALIFVVGVPFLLPHMHDRYFYLADIFAVALGLSHLRFLAVIPLTQLASLISYHIYLHWFAAPQLSLPLIGFDTRVGAAALCVVLVGLAAGFVWKPKGQESAEG